MYEAITCTWLSSSSNGSGSNNNTVIEHWDMADEDEMLKKIEHRKDEMMISLGLL